MDRGMMKAMKKRPDGDYDGKVRSEKGFPLPFRHLVAGDGGRLPRPHPRPRRPSYAAPQLRYDTETSK